MKLKEMIAAFENEGYKFEGYDSLMGKYKFLKPERFGPHNHPVAYHSLSELRFWMKRNGPPIRGNPYYPQCAIAA